MHQQEPATQAVPRYGSRRVDPAYQRTPGIIKTERRLKSRPFQILVESRAVCPARIYHLNYDSIHAKSTTRWHKARNRQRIYLRSIPIPETVEIPLFTSAVKMQQVCLVASRVIAEPLINIRYANLMEHGQTIT